MTIQDQATEIHAFQAQVADIAMALPMLPATAPDRHELAWQFFGLAYHHAVSIVSNFRTHGADLAASPFALSRSLYEAIIRGWWFSLCATDEQAAYFMANDDIPRGVRMSVEIDGQPPFTRPYFSDLIRTDWPIYHSFNHGGMHALRVYAHRPTIDPAFDPQEIQQVLDNTKRMSMLAVFGMCWLVKDYFPAEVEPHYQALLALASPAN